MATINLTPLSFATDIIRPGAGPEGWHNESARIPYPVESQNRGTENSLDNYHRFLWTEIQNGDGSYRWDYLDGLIQRAITKGQKFSFGIMPFRSDREFIEVSYDGGQSGYPEFLHKQMQGEPANSRDWKTSDGVWVPNWNSANYHKALRDRNTAVKDHLEKTTFIPNSGPHKGKTITFADAIYYLEIRGYGNWGEWHTGDITDWNGYPAGRQPTVAGLKGIVDAYTQVWDKWPLVIPIAAFNGGSSGIPLFIPYAEFAYYVLTTKNAWGRIGIRKDQWGAPDSYLAQLAENNNVSYNGVVLKNLIMEVYKTGIVCGEPYPGNLDMTDLMRQVQLYHPTSIGNGNYGPYPSNLAVRDRIRAAFEACGYKIQIENGNFTNTNSAISLTLTWRNGGICPAYEDWTANVLLKNASGAVAAQVASGFKPKFFNTGSTTITDNIPVSLPAGTYTLAIQVNEKYREPMPLFNSGRQADGSYHIGTVTVGSTPVPNQPPVVSAGSDVEITLPVNMVTLIGSATDKDGSISKLLWERQSGSGTPVTPAGNTTLITGLQEGTSIFKFTGTDNAGAASFDTVAIKVNPKPVEPPVPVPDRKLVDIQTTVKTETTFTAVYDDGSKETIVK